MKHIFLLRQIRLILYATAACVWIPFSASASQTLSGHVPGAAKSLAPLQRLDGATPLKLVITLPLRNQEALTNLLRDVYDSSSPAFHHYLTPAQFTEQFGPTPEDYAAVMAFAASNKLAVTGTHANRTMLDVTGAAADIEKAFHLHLQVYRHPTERRNFYAPDREPSLDLATPVLSVFGLDNYQLPRPLAHKRAAGKALESGQPLNVPTGSGNNGEYLGNDFRAVYAPGVNLTGAGQTVGLFELDGFYAGDPTLYAQIAHITNPPPVVAVLTNYNGSAGDANFEVALDIEMAMAVAPGLAQIRVYEGDTGQDVLNLMANEDAANNLSSSWTYPADGGALAQVFTQMALQGQSMFQASGDSGGYFNGQAPAPADSPFVTVVGGTDLTTQGPGGPRQKEVVWNWDNQTNASSGGITGWGIPLWQKGVNMTTNSGSTLDRNIPDVAAVADNVQVVIDDGVTNDYVAGTSCAAPLWAAFTALVNEEAAIVGQPPVGFANPALYTLARSVNYTNYFYDVTNGNSITKTSPSGEFVAKPGYDLCTGWGTPDGTNLIAALLDNPQFSASVLNGGFEAGSFYAWTLNGVMISNNIVYNAVSADPTFVHTGSYGAQMGESGSLGFLSQSIPTTPGQAYLISFWFENPQAGTPNQFQFSWNGQILFNKTNMGTFVWTNFLAIGRATSTSTTLKIGARNDPQLFGLDDVEVLAVPPPVIESVKYKNAKVTITAAVQMGLTYQLQYTTSLNPPVWNKIGSPAAAAGPLITLTDSSASGSQRFYQVIALP